MASLWLKSTQSTTIAVLPGPGLPQTSAKTKTSETLKVFSRQTFALSSTFQDQVKFLLISCKRKSLIGTLLLVTIDSILENATPDVTSGHSFSCEMYCEVTLVTLSTVTFL